MRKTKLASLFLAIVLIMSCFACLPVTAAGYGTSFDNYHIYSTAEPQKEFPLTMEATIYFPSGTDPTVDSGVILSNYKDEKTSSFCLEIKKGGIPVLTLLDNFKNTYTYVFSNVNVDTGKVLHRAIAMDTTASTITCYINGEVAQTLKQRIPSPLTDTLKSITCIGGDNRLESAKAISTYNDHYFQGKMQNVAMYSDTRTADEIKKDYTGKSYDTDNLIGFYEITDNAEKFSDKNGKGPDFNMRYSWAVNPPEVENYDFSFAVVGDTQILVRDTPEKFEDMYDWIINNIESKKIEYVIGLGDITDKDSNIEWGKAREQIMRLNNVVPYTIVRGNHDSKSKYTNYFKYKEFGEVTSDGSFDETMLNTYKKFEIQGNKYMLLNLDVGMDYTQKDADKVLAWANQIVAENADYNVIITTHIYLDGKGELVKQSENPDRYGFYGGEEIWDKLVRKHANISMVLSGHVDHDHIGFSQKKGDNGNTVTQIMVDPQGVDGELGGLGMVAMFYFSNHGKQLDVRYYSTAYDKYFSPKSQISAKIDLLDVEYIDETTGPDDTGIPGTDDDNTSKGGFNALWLLLLIPAIIAIFVVIYFVATMDTKPKEAKEEVKNEEEKKEEAPAEDTRTDDKE